MYSNWLYITPTTHNNIINLYLVFWLVYEIRNLYKSDATRQNQKVEWIKYTLIAVCATRCSCMPNRKYRHNSPHIGENMILIHSIEIYTVWIKLILRQRNFRIQRLLYAIQRWQGNATPTLEASCRNLTCSHPFNRKPRNGLRSAVVAPDQWTATKSNTGRWRQSNALNQYGNTTNTCHISSVIL